MKLRRVKLKKRIRSQYKGIRLLSPQTKTQSKLERNEIDNSDECEMNQTYSRRAHLFD